MNQITGLLTRNDLAKRWSTTPRTIDRRRAMGLLPWVDLARGQGKRPQIRFRLVDVEEYEWLGFLSPGREAADGRIDPEGREEAGANGDKSGVVQSLGG